MNLLHPSAVKFLSTRKYKPTRANTNALPSNPPTALCG